AQRVPGTGTIHSNGPINSVSLHRDGVLAPILQRSEKKQPGGDAMNLDLSPQDIEFQQEVRAFLRDNLTPELAAAGRLATSVFIEPEFTLPWQRILHKKGWVAPHWPKEYGGPG